MEWISTKDKTPDEFQPVWAMEKNHQGPRIMVYAYVEDGEEGGWVWHMCYEIPYYHNGKWELNDCEFDDNYTVTEWMPLPEPPKNQIT